MYMSYLKKNENQLMIKTNSFLLVIKILRLVTDKFIG